MFDYSTFCVVCLLFRFIRTWISAYWYLPQTMQYTNFICLRVWLAPQSFVTFELLVAVSLSVSCVLCFSFSQSSFVFFLHSPLWWLFLFLLPILNLSFFLNPQALSPFSLQKMSILKHHFKIYLVKNMVIIYNFLKIQGPQLARVELLI